MMDPVVSRLQEAITVTPSDIVHQRRVAAVTHAAEGGNISETARVFGVSRKTIHLWKKTADTPPTVSATTVTTSLNQEPRTC